MPAANMELGVMSAEGQHQSASPIYQLPALTDTCPSDKLYSQLL